MKRQLLIIRNLTFVLIYVVLAFFLVAQVGESGKITSYNVSGVSSLRSMHIFTEIIEEIEEAITSYKYRLTSYYPNDDYGSGHCTGSGLCTDKFEITEQGWYTYNGKLVLAAATPYLQNKFGYKENKLYFKYYEELNVTIDGQTYRGVILDTCGACYKNEIIDLYVKDKASVTDRGYRGKNMITIELN